MSKCLNIGGQALIEGIMIKSPNYVAVSTRSLDGKIKTKVDKFTSKTTTNWFYKLPFVRGIVILLEMLFIGMKELIYSANEQVDEEDEKESLKSWHIILTVGISLIFALLLFKALPLFIVKLITMITTINNTFIFNLIEGIIRIGIFLIYLIAISYMEDVKTMFRYHGAEHSTISCYENGKELNVKNVKKFSTIHPRCGTSFLVLTLIISILIFSLIPVSLAYWKLLLLRLPLLFPIGGVSYEFLKLGDKHRNNWFLKGLVVPGMWVQKITTKKPNEKQIEVAIATVKALLKKHKVDV